MASFAERFPANIEKLRTRYAEPHRAYHNWTHIDALLVHFERLEWSSAMGVEIAVYYHDAIYDPLSGKNEAESAELMMDDLQRKVDVATLSHANSLIIATAGHKVPADAEPGLAADCALFLDMDLSILGASEVAFDSYDEAIRKEYAAIPDEIYLPRRRDIMAGFLARPRLFLTDTFHASHDAPARANLQRLVDRLSN
ncbi:MAG: hypothetical protein AAF557_11550 [Pseudomonadota bacterium]